MDFVDMLPQITLSDDQIMSFKKTGYLIIRSGLPKPQMKTIDKWTNELLALPEESGKHWVYYEQNHDKEKKKIVSRIENIRTFHYGFKILSDCLRNPISQLMEEDAILFKEKINFKMPGGTGFKPHQDSQAGWDAYANFFISAFVSIDESTLENGCLEICGGRHVNGLHTSWKPLTKDDMIDMEFIPILTQPGDVIFFDSFTPHQSAPNLSKSPRRIYYATYNAKSSGDKSKQYYRDKHKSYPPDIDQKDNVSYVYRV